MIFLDNGAPHGAGIDAFLSIAARLRAGGFVAPECLHISDDHRFVVLEDLGTATLSDHLAAMPGEETAHYADAAELIAAIGQVEPPPGALALTPEVGAEMLDPFFEYAAPHVTVAQAAEIRALVAEGLAQHANGPRVLSLRDFHAENLIWRPQFTGHAQFGLIDFQDAFLAPAEYDLASLIRDARRDVSNAATQSALQRFAELTGQTEQSTSAAISMLAVQRNLRILGIFHRLIHHSGKPRYATFLPRVHRHLATDLAHPALGRIAAPIKGALVGALT